MFNRIQIWPGGALLWLLMLVVDLGLLWASGAFHAEFGEHPDEPSHYITGLMVRDYVASGFPAPPMPYAENYYLHYPKVALGHYPPFLYLVEAAWMLVFPVSRASLLLLNALLTAFGAALLGMIMARRYGPWAGVGAGIALITSPLVLRFCGMVMAEPLAFCLALCALVFCCRYFEAGRWQDAVWFGLFAALAVLTKQVALFLALVPPITVLLTGKFRLLKRPAFWLPAVIVLAVAGPWYVFAARYFTPTLKGLAAASWTRPSWLEQVSALVGAEGYTLTVLSALGLWLFVIWPAVRRRRVEAEWAVWAAAVVAYQIFRHLAPAAGETRHLINIQPALVALAVGGVAWLLGHVPGPGRWRPAWALLIGFFFLLESFPLPQRRHHGYAEAAAQLTADPRYRDAVFLICSDASGEGAFIAEVAARDRRPGHIVLRASKMLAAMTWNGAAIRDRFDTAAGLQEYMESVPVSVLVVETGGSRHPWRYERLTEEMLQQYPERWAPIATYSGSRARSAAGVQIRAYRLIGSEGRPRSPIRIDLGGRLGRTIGN
ncbi:MAG TPA: glycosyltransferase family 39 protein [Bryobacteraceae bacterium]|nr:glycosyltransferase family 39 protein [Bryobacteraceae bacterium]